MGRPNGRKTAALGAFNFEHANALSVKDRGATNFEEIGSAQLQKQSIVICV